MIIGKISTGEIYLIQEREICKIPTLNLFVAKEVFNQVQTNLRALAEEDKDLQFTGILVNPNTMMPQINYANPEPNLKEKLNNVMMEMAIR